MSKMQRLLEASANRRIYEYRDEEGNVYYSFHRQANIIGSPARLKLKDRKGVHLINFLVYLRRLAENQRDDEG